ncbi:MAG: hypothetical protein IJ080_06555, partial [Oscillospiraceae bacterium]|nr:hypothetical protein [Oscillospiraceae bacterium]
MTTKSSAKAARRPKAAKGAVLLMVLTVMFVLIFLLAGTIAVVYSARNRVMSKYEETQAYYTARSVLDTFVANIVEDNASPVSGATYYYYDADGTVKDTTNVKQGRVMELDLYRVPIKLGTNSSNADYNQWYATGKNENDSDKPFKDYDDHYFNLTSTTAAAAGSTTNIDKFFAQYTVDKDSFSSEGDDCLEYTFKSDLSLYQQQNSGALYSNKLADPGSDVKIRVEVLERFYNLDATAAAAAATSHNEADWAKAFYLGDRQKDHFKFKVTADVIYDGEHTTTSVIYQNGIATTMPNAKGLVSLSDITGGTSLSYIGGASTLHRGDSVISQNDLNASGDLYIQGNWNTGSTGGQYISLHDDQIWFVRGTLGCATDGAIGLGSADDLSGDQSGSRFGKGAVIYAKVIEAGQRSLGASKDHPDVSYDGGRINVVCETFRSKSDVAEQGGVYGRLICEDFDLSQVSGGQIKVHENAYCNYLVLDSSQVATELDPTDLTNSKEYVKIKNEGAVKNLCATGATLYVSQGIKVYDAGTGNYKKYMIGNADPDNPAYSVLNFVGVSDLSNAASTGGALDGISISTPSSTNEIKVSYEDSSDYAYDDSTGMKTFTLPSGVELYRGSTTADKKKLELPTPKSLYGEFFKSAAFDSSNGDFVLANGKKYNDPYYSDPTPYTYTYTDTSNPWWPHDVTVNTTKGEYNAKNDYNPALDTTISTYVRHADKNDDSDGYIAFNSSSTPVFSPV